MDPLFAAVIGVALGGVAGIRWGARRARPTAAPESVDETTQIAPELLREVLDTLTSAVVVVDSSGDIVLANRPATSLALVRGTRIGVAELSALVGDVRRLGEPLDRGLTATDGIALHAWVGPIGAGGYVLLIVEDVTDSHRVDAVRRDFVANVSHELKTPVGALSLLAEAVLDGVDDPVAVRRFAERMQHESHRLARLVQELIDLSRLQGSSLTPDAAAVSVRQITSEAVDRVQFAATAKQIELVVGDIDSLAVHGDARQLVTALGNLLDNAIAYSPHGTRVAVGGRLVNEFVEVSVADQGMGIAPEDTERVFERFYRADPARSRETGGTGLGLAIVKHIASNHGGRVSVWSVEGSGSTFTLHLPAVPASPTTKEGVSAA